LRLERFSQKWNSGKMECWNVGDKGGSKTL
jgi:hypothetical protein